jgi:hypothetical protein
MYEQDSRDVEAKCELDVGCSEPGAEVAAAHAGRRMTEAVPKFELGKRMRRRAARRPASTLHSSHRRPRRHLTLRSSLDCASLRCHERPLQR